MSRSIRSSACWRPQVSPAASSHANGVTSRLRTGVWVLVAGAQLAQVAGVEAQLAGVEAQLAQLAGVEAQLAQVAGVPVAGVPGDL